MAYCKSPVLLVFVLAFIGLSQTYLVQSPFGRIGDCIYACHECFKDKLEVHCANECLFTSGFIHDGFLLRACPQLKLPLYFNQQNYDDDNINFGNPNDSDVFDDMNDIGRNVELH